MTVITMARQVTVILSVLIYAFMHIYKDIGA